jgi:hypothetical protein
MVKINKKCKQNACDPIGGNMWKWFLRRALKALAEPVVDAIIAGLEKLAARTSNTVDDQFVEIFKELRETIIGFIMSGTDDIVKSV